MKLRFIPLQNLLDYFMPPEVIEGLAAAPDCSVLEILSEF